MSRGLLRQPSGHWIRLRAATSRAFFAPGFGASVEQYPPRCSLPAPASRPPPRRFHPTAAPSGTLPNSPARPPLPKFRVRSRRTPLAPSLANQPATPMPSAQEPDRVSAPKSRAAAQRGEACASQAVLSWLAASARLRPAARSDRHWPEMPAHIHAIAVRPRRRAAASRPPSRHASTHEPARHRLPCASNARPWIDRRNS